MLKGDRLIIVFVALGFFMIMTLMFSSDSLAAEENTKVSKSESIFNLPDHKSIKESIKPLNLEKMTEKSKEKGEEIYLFLQQNSVLYLLICLGVGLVFLLLGILIRTFRAVAGFAFFVGIVGFLMINFAPEAVNQFVHWVSNINTD